MHRARCLLTLLLLALLVAPTITAQEPVGSAGGTTTPGVLYRFNITRYNDTLFAAVDTAYRAVFDDDGDVWYSTTSGVVHIDVDGRQRRLFTHQEGLPSSLAIGLAARGDTVYAGTDLGLAVITRSTGAVRPLTPHNSGLPDDIVHDVAADGPSDLWVGTHFGGVAVWNTTSDTWTVKNTSTQDDYAKPVRRIVPTPTAVWVGTDGDGVWKYDRATKNWTVLLMTDGLPSNTVLSVAERGATTYLGTTAGIVAWEGSVARVYNKTHGMPDERAHDIDVVPTVDGGSDLFVATRAGVWQLDPETGGHTVRDQSFGILGTFVYDETETEDKGWVFATTRGVSLLRDGAWTYYATGPSVGASPGPLSFRFTAAYASPDTPYVWAGAGEGLSAFEPASAGKTGRWFNLGEWIEYPGGGVNAIEVAGNMTWLATNTGVYGYNMASNSWIKRIVSGSRNVVYGLDVDGDELWIGLFGDGLIMQDLKTGHTRNWTYESLASIPDEYVTDVRVTPTDVWLGTSIGVVRMDRLSGTFRGTYTSADGIPGDGVIFRVLPDAGVTWVGTKDGGVARLDVATGRVTRVWNHTTVPDYHNEEVRSLYREGGRLWAGTKGGLLRIDIASGDAKLFNQSNSKLVQDFVGGIAEKDGILYLATSSGVSRLDLDTMTFLPMRDDPTAQHGAGANSTATPTRAPVTVRIESPRDGVGVAGVTEVRGNAFQLGGRIDKVEVRVGLGDWQRATGTESWTYQFDAAALPANEPVTVAARAFAGTNVSRESTILLTPVAIPQTPLRIEHAPIASSPASRALLVGAKITGDEPLAATLYYRVEGRDIYAPLAMQRQGSIFTATIPFKDVQQGRLAYYVVAKSGILEQTSPADASDPHVIEVGPPARIAVQIEGPEGLTAKAGNVTSVPLRITNVGSEAGTYVVSAAGLRASWVTVTTDPLTLGPGETRTLNATLEVPLRAFAQETTLTFDVRDTAGVAERASTTVPVSVTEAEVATTTPTPAKTNVPLPTILALAAIAAAALTLRRRAL